jgi:hypothetical protein
MDFSWIQQHALSILLRQEQARAIELCPRDVAPNLFSYHLERLVATGYVQKMARGTYSLTTKGHKLAGTFSTNTGKQTENIKTVIMFYSKTDEGNLAFRWSRQPYLGYVTPVYDRLGFDVSLNDGLQTAMVDKLGQMVDVTYKANAFIKIVHEKETISHMSAYIYEVNSEQLKLPFIGRNGEVFVADRELKMMEGVAEFLEKIDRHDTAFDAIWHY